MSNATVKNIIVMLFTLFCLSVLSISYAKTTSDATNYTPCGSSGSGACRTVEKPPTFQLVYTQYLNILIQTPVRVNKPTCLSGGIPRVYVLWQATSLRGTEQPDYGFTATSEPGGYWMIATTGEAKRSQAIAKVYCYYPNKGN